MSTVMKDLCSYTFCVPVVYKNSSLSYCRVNEIHWHSDAAKHSGVETVWRYVLKLGYILQGREWVKKVQKNCERCRYLRQKGINIEMGPVLSRSLRIAPTFLLLELTFADHSKHILLTTKEQRSKFG